MERGPLLNREEGGNAKAEQLQVPICSQVSYEDSWKRLITWKK